MLCSVRRELEKTAEILREVWDIVSCRVTDASPPSWCERRGWSEYLLSLSDQELAAAEQEGLERSLHELPAPPASLAELAARVARLVDPFRSPVRQLAAPASSVHVPLRKRPQVAAVLAECCASFPDVPRVVEVGAGRGHASRALAGALAADVVGIDRDASLVARARELALGQGVRFSVADGEAALRLAAGDLVVGLHACGGLGDALVRQAAQAGAHVLLVSCCLQKIRADVRQPLSGAASELNLSVRRSALGLTNLASFAEIGHAAAVTRGRQVRCALRLLLAARGTPAAVGEEARGIHRRKFRQGLGAVAGQALALRELPPPTDEEIAQYAVAGEAAFRFTRRLSLPRAMLGRVVELAVVLDRASYLEEMAYQVNVKPLFSRAISPRNLAVLATAPAR